jgi:hypothetical protein
MTRHIGTALLLGAVIAPVLRFVVVQTVDWTPLEIPLSADGGVAREFSVEKSGKYEVAIAIERPPVKSSSDEVECLLGFDWVECPSTDPVVAPRWILKAQDGGPVHCDGEPVDPSRADGRSSSGRFTPTTVERWLGCFDAREDARYVLDVRVSNLERLSDVKPRFVVISSAALDREQHSLTAAVWLTSVFLGLAGFLLVDRRR